MHSLINPNILWLVHLTIRPGSSKPKTSRGCDASSVAWGGRNLAVAGEGMSLRRDGGPDSFSGAPRDLGALLINGSKNQPVRERWNGS